MQIETNQRIWRATSNIENAIAFALSKEKITKEQAGFYLRHKGLYYTFMAAKLAEKSLEKIIRIFPDIAGKMIHFDYLGAAKSALSNTFLGLYWAQRAKNDAYNGIDEWEHRGKHTRQQADKLRHAVEHEGTSSYLTDAAVHMAMYLPSKLVQGVILPAMIISGEIEPILGGFGILFFNSLIRTAYTVPRGIHNFFQNHEVPVTALVVGALPIPIVSNFAFQAQMLKRTRTEEGDLAKFLIYKGAADVGRKIPVWGGEDSWLEYTLNKIPDLFIKDRTPYNLDDAKEMKLERGDELLLQRENLRGTQYVLARFHDFQNGKMRVIDAYVLGEPHKMNGVMPNYIEWSKTKYVVEVPQHWNAIIVGRENIIDTLGKAEGMEIYSRVLPIS